MDFLFYFVHMVCTGTEFNSKQLIKNEDSFKLHLKHKKVGIVISAV